MREHTLVKRLTVGLLSVITLFATRTSPSVAADGGGSASKLCRILAEKARPDNGEMVDVIVTFTQQPAGGAPSLAPALGGERKKRYEKLPFEAMQVPARALTALANNPKVRFVTLDGVVSGASIAARETARVPGSATVSSGSNTSYTGTDVTVAVLDSGVFSHGDYYGTLVKQFDFVGSASGTETAFQDGYGHGTHVAGMIGADGYYSYEAKYRGAATRGDIISLRVLNDFGVGTVSDLLQALDWILTTGIHTYKVRVANLSLGAAVTTALAQDPLVLAVDRLWDAGVVVVVSAGNFGWSGHFTIASPGTSRKVITVGSLTDNGTGSDFSDDYVSTYSSRGPTLYDHVLKPDLLAPGNRVISTFAEQSFLGRLLPGNLLCGRSSSCYWRYLSLSGSSMATAVVSGAVARMLHKNTSLSPSTVKARLMKSARKIAGDPAVVGAGVLDAEAALNLTDTVSNSYKALSPLIKRSDDRTRLYVEDTSKLWGGSQWAASYIWAIGSLWSSSYTATSGYVWSDASSWSSGYLWSNCSLWPGSSTWSSGYIWSNGFVWPDTVLPFSVGTEDPGFDPGPGGN